MLIVVSLRMPPGNRWREQSTHITCTNPYGLHPPSPCHSCLYYHTDDDGEDEDEEDDDDDGDGDDLTSYIIPDQVMLACVERVD